MSARFAKGKFRVVCNRFRSDAAKEGYSLEDVDLSSVRNLA
jgi:hypothetical protein